MPESDPSVRGPNLASQLAARPLAVGWACLRATGHLGWARIVLMRLSTAEIAARNQAADLQGRGADAGIAQDQAEVASLAAILPRVAYWLPWRSDCLVQALAAQRMLAGKGIASQIVIGVDNTSEKGFEPHAWLRYGDKVVTGGEVARFAVLLDAGGRPAGGER